MSEEAVMFTTIVVMIILFAGEPDLLDAIINRVGGY